MKLVTFLTALLFVTSAYGVVIDVQMDEPNAGELNVITVTSSFQHSGCSNQTIEYSSIKAPSSGVYVIGKVETAEKILGLPDFGGGVTCQAFVTTTSKAEFAVWEGAGDVVQIDVPESFLTGSFDISVESTPMPVH